MRIAVPDKWTNGLLLSGILVLSLFSAGYGAIYSGGDGSAGNPYQINSYDDMMTLVQTSADWGKSFILTADIDLAADDWTEAVVAWDTSANAGFQGASFTGSFNGNHHTLSGLKVNGSNYLGLFGKLSYATISNLTIQNAQIVAADSATNIGILAGWSEGSRITNCAVSGTVAGGSGVTCIGGVIGYNRYSTIESCTMSGSVTAGGSARYVGGVAGRNVGSGSTTPAVIQSCQATVTVTGGAAASEIGGLTGEQDKTGDRISTCLVSGTIEGGDGAKKIGGLVGFNFGGTVENSSAENIIVKGGALANQMGGAIGTNYSDVTGCWATGSVLGGTDCDEAGGLVGYNYGTGKIRNCHADCTVTGTGDSSDLGGLAGNNESPAIITACQAKGLIAGGSVMGGLAGRNGGVISLCVSSASVTGPDGSYVLGGLAGYNKGVISQSRAEGSVQSGSATSDLGGLAGTLTGTSVISGCFSAVAVSGGNNASRVGGLVGNLTGGSVTNCYATGAVSGKYNLGGLVGYFNKSTAMVNNCYATGAVTGESGALYLGGLVGVLATGTVSNCFWDTQTTLLADPAGYSAGTLTNVFGKLTGEMKTRATYTDYGWDFLGETANGTADGWRLCVDETHYPRLTWQHLQMGDFTCPDGVAMDDFNYLATRWLNGNCAGANNCSGVDLDLSGTVDLNDFTVVARHWLEVFL